MDHEGYKLTKHERKIVRNEMRYIQTGVCSCGHEMIGTSTTGGVVARGNVRSKWLAHKKKKEAEIANA